MKNLYSWLISIFVVMFWIFRIVITYMSAMGIEYAIKPFDMNTEVALLFITFVAILFIFRRKLIGGLIYLIGYVYYFGGDALNGVKQMLNSTGSIDVYMSTICSLVAIILAICITFDLLVNRDRHESHDDSNTFWFYKNKKYDRKLDERADKNQYKID